MSKIRRVMALDRSEARHLWGAIVGSQLSPYCSSSRPLCDSCTPKPSWPCFIHLVAPALHPWATSIDENAVPGALDGDLEEQEDEEVGHRVPNITISTCIATSHQTVVPACWVGVRSRVQAPPSPPTAPLRETGSCGNSGSTKRG